MAEVTEESPKGALLPAVVLPEDDQDGSVPMVLVPAKHFEIEQAIALQRGDRSNTAVLTKLVEQGPGFELYEYIAVS